MRRTVKQLEEKKEILKKRRPTSPLTSKEFSISAMCRVLEVSVSGYHRRLRQSREECNHKCVERLMRDNGIRAKGVKKFKATTNSRHSNPVAENVLARVFTVSDPNGAWVPDITYLWTDEGWLYLAIFMDLFSQMIVGWSFPLSDGARGARENQSASSFRSRKPVRRFYIQREASGPGLPTEHEPGGNCWDNAVAGGFFSTLKLELVADERFNNRQQARDSIFEYVKVFYNQSRIHSATDYLSPAEYEEQFKRTA